jgi:choline kinase
MGSRPLIDHQIRALRAAGVDDIVLVVGYEADQIRHHCGDSVRFVENREFAKTNSIYSLYLARHELDADTFLFNCDIIFHAQVLQRLVAADVPNAVAVDGAVKLQAGEMNVKSQPGGKVRAIGKQLAPDSCQSMSVQLVRFGAAGARLVAAEVERLIGLDERDVFPTSAFGPLVDSGGLFAVEVGDLPWAEIDDLDDYQRAVDLILPRLAGSLPADPPRQP